ncbi:hypothetical protein M9H77_26993 [Catharanthus roseus]|uniref:Uncharacterized protein n=1 Tax=Catharanthus roseus TaxID=4058 RepID=A0ACC0ACT1_CATRO|nr:hypothetical protein M9H77_26993 [Catharanthus roseus]
MLHKIDKGLPTIISHVKGVRIVLERDCLASILGILDNGNTDTENDDYQQGCNKWDKRRKEYIPPSEEARLWDRTVGSFRPIKKTTRSSIEASSSQLGEDDDEAKASDDEEDGDGAQTQALWMHSK